jgi:hypothetical protein
MIGNILLLEKIGQGQAHGSDERTYLQVSILLDELLVLVDLSPRKKR